MNLLVLLYFVFVCFIIRWVIRFLQGKDDKDDFIALCLGLFATVLYLKYWVLAILFLIIVIVLMKLLMWWILEVGDEISDILENFESPIDKLKSKINVNSFVFGYSQLFILWLSSKR